MSVLILGEHEVRSLLTMSECIEAMDEVLRSLAQGELPEVRKDAAKLFDVLVSKGYHPFYMTARPEWLGARTRALKSSKPGTTTSLT